MPIVSVENFISAQFDYLILGGGTAGLTLASRLSDDPSISVGVLEAGHVPVNCPEIDIPAYMGRTIANPTYDWTFFSVPQVHADGRTILQPRGKGLGGSSMVNFLGLFRPSKVEFDALESLGNKGWNWDNLLHYMKKSETTFPSGLSSLDAEKFAANPTMSFHGTHGPVKKSFPSNFTKQQALLFDTAAALGVPRNVDMGDGTNVGSMTSFTSVDPQDATRSYALPAYFTPIKGRPNLLVLTGAHVTKVIFERDSANLQCAVGAEFVYEGVKYSVKGIKKDIILSAGAFQTPQLLELSGIGNPSILQKHSIEALVDLPGVGENLQEHSCVAIIVKIDEKYQTMEDLADPNQLKIHQDLYKQQKGLLASVPAAAFLFLSPKHLNVDVDNISFQNTHTDPSLRRGLDKQHELHKAWLQNEEMAQAEILNYNGHQPLPHPLPEPGKRYNTFVSAVMHPLSRGSVHLASKDPLAPPAIDPNYLSNPADLEILAKAVGFTTRLLDTAPLKDIVRGYVLPRTEVMGVGGAGKLKEWIKATVGPTFHPLGTAAMLPKEDGGVVDAELKVYGTTNLRVVDVSILPLQLSCHIQSVAYAIGEKAADILKRQHAK